MPPTNKDQVIEKALTLLINAPQGIRFMEMARAVQEALPHIPKNTIQGTLWDMDVKLPDLVFKPARGLWFHAKYREKDQPKTSPPIKDKVSEKSFYEPFANWLVNELEECTKAIEVGGSLFKDKWGTPDVIGIRQSKNSDVVKFPTEIVSAEIKLDTANLITAFGQACAYRLFSHKSYIVVPVSSPPDDIARLDTLSRICGIGLILFNANDPKAPDFEIRVRATKQDPDMFYVNRSMKLIEDKLFN
jgi:hypothetical protein